MADLKLYLLSQSKNDNYDTYDALIVAAKDEEEARQSKYVSLDYWTHPEYVSVVLIGVAADEVKPGLLLGSFNAG